MKNMQNLTVIFLATVLLTSVGCKSKSEGTTTGNPLTEDTSSSGAVVAAVGGALSGSTSGGVVAQSPAKGFQKLFTSVQPMATCPTFLSSAGNGCAASGSTMWLTYSACNFPNSSLTFTGVQALIKSSGAAACGSFPNPGASATLYRQFVSASGGTTASHLIQRNSYGTAAYIDNSSANLGNFDNQTIPTLINGGYGSSITFNGSGARSAISLAHRVFAVGSFDHSVYGNLSISESAGASSRTVSGSITVYYNGMQVVGTTTISNITHNDMCCLPVSGSVTTSFAAGANVAPTTIGSLLVGKSETLTLTGCGTGTLTKYDGSVENVALTRCY